MNQGCVSAGWWVTSEDACQVAGKASLRDYNACKEKGTPGVQVRWDSKPEDHDRCIRPCMAWRGLAQM